MRSRDIFSYLLLFKGYLMRRGGKYLIMMKIFGGQNNWWQISGGQNIQCRNIQIYRQGVQRSGKSTKSWNLFWAWKTWKILGLSKILNSSPRFDLPSLKFLSHYEIIMMKYGKLWGGGGGRIPRWNIKDHKDISKKIPKNATTRRRITPQTLKFLGKPPKVSGFLRSLNIL